MKMRRTMQRSKRLYALNNRWWLMAVFLAIMLVAGCSNKDAGVAGPAVDPGVPASAVGSPGTPGAAVNPEIPVAPADPGPVAAVALTVQGNVVGDAAAALTGAPLAGGDPAPATLTSVPLTGAVSVVLVDETANVAASQTVTAGNGNFILVAPPGHTYVLLFRDGSPAGRTICPLIADRQSGRISFSIPAGSADVKLGNVTLDSQVGKAWSWTDVALAPPAVAFPFDLVEWRGTSNVPTDAPPTPTFGAQPFTQQMIRFEEFGVDNMPTAAAAGFTPLPQPQNAQNGPTPNALEAFLAQPGVAPFPTRLANVTDTNPWKPAIETFLGHALIQPPAGVPGPAEGRPPGEDWAHQQWNDLYPQKFFKTTVGSARVNGGFRNARQRHSYALGEFGPGGLYHRVFTSSVPGAPTLDGTTAGVSIRLHPNMPVQDPNSVWTFDGTLPPKLLVVRYGEPTMMRNYNTLPLDETANHPVALDNTMISNGFGRHTISTHDHNGHSPGESDGFAGGFFFPGQFWDYRWPMQLAGHSNNNNAAGAINFDASDPRAATPCEAGETLPVLINGTVTARACDANGRIQIPGDWRETMGTHWFHDHMLDHTAENVYKGNATFMTYYSALDRGNEAINDSVNLRLPSGTALNWGNRDYDVILLMADKATDKNGQLWFNTVDRDGFLGDVMTVNWLYKPYFDVRARKYRFRLSNGGVARLLSVGLVRERNDALGEMPGPAGSGKSYDRVPFHMIGNDGNILEHAVPFDGVRDIFHDGNPNAWKGQLPSQTVAERYDIVVDFTKHGIKPGDKLYFVNIMEHQDGRGSKSKVPLADILAERYKPTVLNGRWINGDPAVGKFLEIRVKAYAGTDLSMNPADYEPGKLKMLPLALDRAAQTVNGVSLLTARHHTMEFVRSQSGHGAPWMVKVDGGAANTADPHRISAIEHGDLEVWTIKGGGGWTHPVHIHYEEGMILTRMGKLPPDWELYGKKDMYRIGPENDSGGIIEIAYRARDFLGDYVMHCHNTTHEDHAMLLRWDARLKGSRLADTPMPTWDGVFFEPSFALPLADIGDGIGPKKGVPLN